MAHSGTLEVARQDAFISATIPLHSEAAMRWPKVPNNPSWEQLRGLGWKRRRATSDCSLDYLYISPCKQFIAKEALITSSKPRCAIPTKFLDGHPASFYDDCMEYRWMIQPKADRSSRGLADAKMRMEDLRALAEDADVHYGNIGMYRGKAVLIDW